MTNNSLKICINLDNKTEEFSFDESDICQYITLSVTKKIDLSTFIFQLKIYDENDSLVFDNIFPNGIVLLTTDLDELHCFQFFFEPNKRYKLEIRYSYLGIDKIINFDFLGIKPYCPYKSWIWKENNWQAPVPLPEDAGTITGGRLYEWNEEDKFWIPLGGYDVE
jgi:hypothetical protein